MRTLFLEPYRGLSDQEALPLLQASEPFDLKRIGEETEHFLLCFPQGTGDDELEETLATLYDLFCETPELCQYISGDLDEP